ncbi:MAG: hypothetical protein ACXVPN_08815 [Bacteroidia bacterium]
MKRSFLICLVFAFSIFLSGCKKNNNDAVADGSFTNYSSSSATANPGGPFSFTKITINPNPVKIGVASKLTATVTGTNLTFVWTTSHGDLFGKGAAIYYSDSCIGEYSVTCTVSDGTHSKTITVPISVSN